MADKITTFKKIWYLPSENKWRNFRPLAFRDEGKLIIDNNSIIFEGKKEKVEIRDITHLSYGKQGWDLINNWVKVEYGKGDNCSTAFFANGGGLGWSGIFGGTKKILSVMQKTISEDETISVSKSREESEHQESIMSDSEIKKNDKPLAEYNETLYTDTKSSKKTNSDDSSTEQRYWRDVDSIEKKVDKLHITRAQKPATAVDKTVDKLIEKRKKK